MSWQHVSGTQLLSLVRSCTNSHGHAGAPLPSHLFSSLRKMYSSRSILTQTSPTFSPLTRRLQEETGLLRFTGYNGWWNVRGWTNVSVRYTVNVCVCTEAERGREGESRLPKSSHTHWFLHQLIIAEWQARGNSASACCCQLMRITVSCLHFSVTFCEPFLLPPLDMRLGKRAL